MSTPSDTTTNSAAVAGEMPNPRTVFPAPALVPPLNRENRSFTNLLGALVGEDSDPYVSRRRRLVHTTSSLGVGAHIYEDLFTSFLRFYTLLGGAADGLTGLAEMDSKSEVTSDQEAQIQMDESLRKVYIGTRDVLDVHFRKCTSRLAQLFRVTFGVGIPQGSTRTTHDIGNALIDAFLLIVHEKHIHFESQDEQCNHAQKEAFSVLFDAWVSRASPRNTRSSLLLALCIAWAESLEARGLLSLSSTSGSEDQFAEVFSVKFGPSLCAPVRNRYHASLQPVYGWAATTIVSVIFCFVEGVSGKVSDVVFLFISIVILIVFLFCGYVMAIRLGRIRTNDNLRCILTSVFALVAAMPGRLFEEAPSMLDLHSNPSPVQTPKFTPTNADIGSRSAKSATLERELGRPSSRERPFSGPSESQDQSKSLCATSKPAVNPLSAPMLGSESAAGIDADFSPDSVVVDASPTLCVKVDPSGTFCLPFFDDAIPILLDGGHIHKHVAIIGVEFTDPPVPVGGEEGTDRPAMYDRYGICLWNHGAVEATGGFSAETALSLHLSDIMADTQSFKAVDRLIRAAETEFAYPTRGLPTDRIVVRMVHRDTGDCRFQLSVAPVIIRSGDRPRSAAEGEASVGDSDGAVAGPFESIVGAILIGIPIDPKIHLSSYAFRGQYLSDCLRYFISACRAAHDIPMGWPSGTTPSEEHLDPFIASHIERTNSATMENIMLAISKFEPIDDSRWEPVFSSYLPDLLSQIFPDAVVDVDSTVPEFMDCDVSGIGKLLTLVKTEVGPRTWTAFSEDADSRAGTQIIRVFSISFEVLAVQLSIPLNAEPEGTRFSVDLASTLQASGTQIPARLADGHAFVHFIIAGNPQEGSGQSAKSGQSLAQSQERNPGPATDRVTFLFPFRVHVEASSNWSDVVRRATITDLSKSGAFHRESSAPSPASTSSSSTNIVSVLVAIPNEIESSKLLRTLFTKGHAVCTLARSETYGTEGVAILRSGFQKIEAVILRCERQTTAKCDVEELLEMYSEFDDIVFIVLHNPLCAHHQVLTGSKPRPNVVSIPLFALSSEMVLSVLRTLVARVIEMRKTKQKRTEFEKLFMQHRGSPWVRGKKLGSGTFGDVYEAQMTLTGGKMAVKIIRMPEKEQRLRDAIVNEIGILCRVSHPNIVQYFYCEAGGEGEIHLFMELCSGGTLARYCSSRQGANRMNESEISCVIHQVLSALSYLHMQGIAHRDIKPANVLLNSGKVKLGDFGTAAAVFEAKSRQLDGVAGTMRYMAPEVVEGRPYDMSCDIWSVGCLVLELFGALPPSAPLARSFADYKSDDAIVEHIDLPSRDASIFVQSCLRMDPTARPTAEQLQLLPFVSNVRRSMGLHRKTLTPSVSTSADSENAAGDGVAVVKASEADDPQQHPTPTDVLWQRRLTHHAHAADDAVRVSFSPTMLVRRRLTAARASFATSGGFSGIQLVSSLNRPSRPSRTLVRRSLPANDDSSPVVEDDPLTFNSVMGDLVQRGSIAES